MGIVTISNGVPVASSVAIAAGTDNQHKNVLELIRTYQADLEEFGGVAFESQPFETAGGTQKREVALLNEQQSTLLITYLRNSEVVRGFKKTLVRAFYELRDGAAPKLPQTFAQALMLAAQQAQQIEEQAAKLAIAAPAVEFVSRYVKADGLKGFREVCKLLKANQTDFRIFLMDQRVMYRLAGKLMAYQPHIDAGRFDIKAGIALNNGHAYNDCRFTPKGVEWIAGEWAKYRLRESVEA